MRNVNRLFFKTHTGKALIRSAARQAAALETSFGRALGVKSKPPRAKKIRSRENVETVNNIAQCIRNNQYLKRCAQLIDDLQVSILPPEIDNDIVIHMIDANNATVRVDSLGIKIAVLEGKLCVYPREDLGENILCGSFGQQRAIFFNSANNKWTHGCNTSFESIDSSIAFQANFTEINASLTDVRSCLLLKNYQKLDITHIFKYLFYHADGKNNNNKKENIR